MGPEVHENLEHYHQQQHRLWFSQVQRQPTTENQDQLHENNSTVGLRHLVVESSTEILIAANEIVQEGISVTDHQGGKGGPQPDKQLRDLSETRPFGRITMTAPRLQ